jgi:hypothetical protein
LIYTHPYLCQKYKEINNVAKKMALVIRVCTWADSLHLEADASYAANIERWGRYGLGSGWRIYDGEPSPGGRKADPYSLFGCVLD